MNVRLYSGAKLRFTTQKWRTPGMFRAKYPRKQASYKKAAKTFISNSTGSFKVHNYMDEILSKFFLISLQSTFKFIVHLTF